MKGERLPVSACVPPPEGYREREIQQPEQERPGPGASDLIRFCIAGMLRANPDISKQDVARNLAAEFRIQEKDILPFSPKYMWINPQVCHELEERFGGSPFPKVADDYPF